MARWYRPQEDNWIIQANTMKEQKFTNLIKAMYTKSVIGKVRR